MKYLSEEYLDSFSLWSITQGCGPCQAGDLVCLGRECSWPWLPTQSPITIDKWSLLIGCLIASQLLSSYLPDQYTHNNCERRSEEMGRKVLGNTLSEDTTYIWVCGVSWSGSNCLWTGGGGQLSLLRSPSSNCSNGAQICGTRQPRGPRQLHTLSGGSGASNGEIKQRTATPAGPPSMYPISKYESPNDLW